MKEPLPRPAYPRVGTKSLQSALSATRFIFKMATLKIIQFTDRFE
ncbi:hypothetical protein QR665_09755 [Acinetobacter gerneri]|nr:hypothetical protein [Acinetobacter gerneri]MDV2439754.1 hypothetical protein [Acinetobacter gerneri]